MMTAAQKMTLTMASTAWLEPLLGYSAPLSVTVALMDSTVPVMVQGPHVQMEKHLVLTLVVTRNLTVTPVLLEVSVQEESPLFALTAKRLLLDLQQLLIALHVRQGGFAREEFQSAVVRVISAQQVLLLKLLVQ
jgi:hypothetical protein